MITAYISTISIYYEDHLHFGDLSTVNGLRVDFRLGRTTPVLLHRQRRNQAVMASKMAALRAKFEALDAEVSDNGPKRNFAVPKFSPPPKVISSCYGFQ